MNNNKYILKSRGFEIVSDEHRKFLNDDIKLPLRGSKICAGYDFYTNEMIRLQPGEEHVFWTDIKAYMLSDEVLKIHVRSSSIFNGLNLKNQTGIIDSDYFSNSKNDGNIGICLKNITENRPPTISEINSNKTFDSNVFIKKGDRIAQGILHKYLESDNCNSNEDRNGGYGSTT